MTDTDVRRIEDKVDQLAITLARLEGSLQPTLEKLTEGQKDTDDRITEVERRTNDRLDDHEDRMRGLERFRYAVPSLALLSFLVSIALLTYYLLLPHHGR